jgi:Zn-dependent protease with chaperone function
MSKWGLHLQLRVWRAGLLALVCAAPLWAATPPRFDPKEEAQVGKEAAAEVDKAYDRVDNKEAAAKIQKMADLICAKTPRSDVKYQVRLVKEKKPAKETPTKGKKPPEEEVNAFSLPGGYIYVTQGLLKEVQSDDELAGVLAHEITHNVNYDGMVQAQRASKVFKGELAAVLASILLGGINNPAWFEVMQAANLAGTGVLGGYSIEMEKRADRDAVQYMLGTPYDPVGLLTFMERLAAKERRDPRSPMGVFQTHPLSVERVQYLTESLEADGLTINRRKTTRWQKPLAEQRKQDGKDVWQVLFQGETIFICSAPTAQFKTAQERATHISDALTEALANGAESYSFATGTSDGKPALLANDKAIVVAEAADVAAPAGSPLDVVRNSYQAMRRALVREGLARLY